MAEAITTEAIPIVTGDDAVMRIRGTRVTLDTVVAAFEDGATAEEIAQQYPSASLADIYQAIGYYLRHAAELESYFVSRRLEADKTRRSNEARWPADGIRSRLHSRRAR